MKIRVITLFPELATAVAKAGVVGRAAASGLLDLGCIDPRNFAELPHRRVDDRPYGGGPGMVMMYAPVVAAIRAAKAALPGTTRVIGLTPQGRRFRQCDAALMAQMEHFVLVCGRYEGIDERVAEAEFDDELSLGDFVISGGEIAAMAVIDAVTRLLPGALGDEDSANEDSFSDGLLDCPHYTRPELVESRPVPRVLLGGDHGEIGRWRRMQSLGRTWRRRPEMLAGRELSDQDTQLLARYRATESKSSL